MQRYLCNFCNHSFQNKHRQKRQEKELFNQYIWQRQTYADLANKYDRSTKWVQRKLDAVVTKNVVKINDRNIIIVADATFFSKKNGLCVFREPNLKKNVWWKFTDCERMRIYEQGKIHLEKNGFTIKAVVLDGRRGVRDVFRDKPAQMCHFHQKQIVRRYLTDSPKLEASIELKNIMATLSKTDEWVFTNELNTWYKKWEIFLKEKTINPETDRWCYTHKKVRSAYRSLKTNLPYLFTYQKYPELKIPNTTNSLDGFFNSLKSKLNVHRGLGAKRVKKVIIELLKGRN